MKLRTGQIWKTPLDEVSRVLYVGENHVAYTRLGVTFGADRVRGDAPFTLLTERHEVARSVWSFRNEYQQLVVPA